MTSGLQDVDPSDEELLAAHVRGDPDAFGTLLRRHQERLWAVAVRTLGDRDEAADALQDACVSAFRRAGTFRGDAAVTTWLHRIVVNACLDRMRRRAVRAAVPLDDDVPGLPSPPDATAQFDTADAVRAALATLPAEQQAALILVDVEGYPVAEAARILQTAEGTVKSRCSRARLRLRELLGPVLVEGNPEPPGCVRSPSAADGGRARAEGGSTR